MRDEGFEQTLLNPATPGPYTRGAAIPAASARQAAAQGPSGRSDARQARADSVPRPQPERPGRSSAPVEAATRRAPEPSRSSGPSPAANPESSCEYVAAVYAANEVDVGPEAKHSIAELFRRAQDQGQVYHTSRPAVGDLAFFHNTFDRNRDGRNNDWYTHVALVESVAADGTITLLSYLGGKVDRSFMNLEAPTLASREGSVVNSRLRRESDRDPAYTEYLAGKLFAGFGSLLGNRSEVIVLDDWKPSTSQSASR
jgi:surface antigen